MSKQPPDLDAPIFGAEEIARAARMFTRDGKPSADKVYYKVAKGLLDGVVHRNGRELVTTRRQLQRIGTISVGADT
jgi:hypothetical protein